MKEKVSPQPRLIDGLLPEELEPYLNVPGWRIWRHTIFDQGTYLKALETAATKPLALNVIPDGMGYFEVWDRNEEGREVKTSILFRGSDTFDRPGFLLEPLSEEEVYRIDEQGKLPRPSRTVDKTVELFREGDFRKLFEGS